MFNLGEIVGSALRSAGDGTKVASMRDVGIEDKSFQSVDDWLGTELGQREEETSQQKQAAAAPAATSALDDIGYALKLAQALEHGAVLVQKLAAEGGLPHSSGSPRGGPATVYAQPFASAHVVVPKPQASGAARAAQANRTMEDGHPKTDDGVPSNEGPTVPPGNFGRGGSKRLGNAKTAAATRSHTERQIATKLAQHAALVSLGRIDAAEETLKEARLLKRAADGISNGPNSLVHTSDSLAGTMFPDNEGVRNLTKAQARDASQRQAGSYFNEPVKKDNAVKAHMLSDAGLKLSAAQLLKQAARKQAGIGDALLAVGKGTAGVARAGLRGVGSAARSGAKAVAANAPAGGIGPRQAPGLLERGLQGVRGQAAKARQGLGNLSDTQKKIVGGTVLGTAGLGTAGVAHHALGGNN